MRDRFESREYSSQSGEGLARSDYDDLPGMQEFIWPWERVRALSPVKHNLKKWFCYLDVNELLQNVVWLAVSTDKDSGLAIRNFAGRTYAHCLLAQVYHCHFFLKNLRLPRPQSSLVFPEVDGVITLSGTHVCPAVLPAMLLYFNPSMLIPSRSSMNASHHLRVRRSYAPRYVGLEADTWKVHESLFDEHVEKVAQRVMDYLRHLCGPYIRWNNHLQIDGEKFRAHIVQKFLEEHKNLKVKVMQGSDEGRLINSWAFKYPVSTEMIR